jgi:hypothetical protein
MKKVLIACLIIIVIIIALICIILFNAKSKPEIQIKVTPINLESVLEIQQDGDYFVAAPVKMLGYKEKIYILDLKFHCILVFTEEGFSHTIGRFGKGPGEITEIPKSFRVFEDNVYILNHPDKIEILSINGDYKGTIRLKYSEQYFSPSDFEIYGNHIYICLSIGETRVQKYNLEGNFVENFIKGGNEIGPYKYKIINPYELHIDIESRRIILFNRFNGDIEVFDLIAGTPIYSVKRYDDQISERITRIIKEINKNNLRSYSKELKSIAMWQSAFDENNSRILIIPSQNTVDSSDRENILYIFDIKYGFLLKSFIKLGSFEKIIKHCCFLEEKIAFMDYSLNLFIGGYK